MAFLGGSVSVFALRWAVGFLGNISRSRDMGFNARVTATVMLTGIGSWHLSPGPARPGLLTYVVEYGGRLAALSALHGLSIGCAGNMPEPRSTIFTHAAVLWMGLTAPFGSHVLRQYLSGPNQLPPPDGLPTRSWQVWSRPAFQLLHVGWIWFAALHRPTQLRTTIHA